MDVIAIDPGPLESAIVLWDGKQPAMPAKLPNKDVLAILCGGCHGYDPQSYSPPPELVIEQVVSYGMAIGKSTIETIWWSGRFYEAYMPNHRHMMPRVEVKKHICMDGRAKDSNIIQALVDRFAPYERNKGKGTKAAPGVFYGFKSDIWQAFALAVTYYDNAKGT